MNGFIAGGEIGEPRAPEKSFASENAKEQRARECKTVKGGTRAFSENNYGRYR